MTKTIGHALLAMIVLAPLPARSQLKRTEDAAPPAKAVTTGDYLLGCTPDQQKTVTDAAGLASTLLHKKADDLKAELATMEGPPATLTGEKTQAALKKHFKLPLKVGNHKGVMQHLVTVYGEMYRQLVDPLHWPALSCVDELKFCHANTYGYTLKIKGASTYLCPLFFDEKNPRRRAGTLIHEMAHRDVKGASEDDFYEKGYYTLEEPPALSMADSLNNPDSYAYFVTDSASSAKKKP